MYKLLKLRKEYNGLDFDKITYEEFYEEERITDSIEEPQKIEEVEDQNKVNYIAILKIPKIKLDRGLVEPSSYLNNVKYNLQ